MMTIERLTIIFLLPLEAQRDIIIHAQQLSRTHAMIILHDIVNFSVATLQLAIYTSIRSIGTKSRVTVFNCIQQYYGWA